MRDFGETVKIVKIPDAYLLKTSRDGVGIMQAESVNAVNGSGVGGKESVGGGLGIIGSEKAANVVGSAEQILKSGRKQRPLFEGVSPLGKVNLKKEARELADKKGFSVEEAERIIYEGFIARKESEEIKRLKAGGPEKYRKNYNQLENSNRIYEDNVKKLEAVKKLETKKEEIDSHIQEVNAGKETDLISHENPDEYVKERLKRITDLEDDISICEMYIENHKKYAEIFKKLEAEKASADNAPNVKKSHSEGENVPVNDKTDTEAGNFSGNEEKTADVVGREETEADVYSADETVVEAGKGVKGTAEEKLQADVDAWGKTVDGMASKPKNNVLMLTQTPLVFRLVGADFRNVYAAPHVFNGMFSGKAKAGHNAHPEINADVLKQIPKALTDPIAIFKSKTHDNRFVFMVDVQDKNGATVVVPVEFEVGKDFEAAINIAVTAYTKNNSDGTPRNKWFADNAENLVYINKEKKGRWDTSAGSKSLWVLPNDLSKNQIFTEDDLVKLKSEAAIVLSVNTPSQYAVFEGRDLQVRLFQE